MRLHILCCAVLSDVCRPTREHKDYPFRIVADALEYLNEMLTMHTGGWGEKGKQWMIWDRRLSGKIVFNPAVKQSSADSHTFIVYKPINSILLK